MLSAQEAKRRLIDGNEEYIGAEASSGDISPEIRRSTAENGQHPYAVIVACSDSRVIPESIFSAGIGELFVIRVAGNVVGPHELGSIEYAVDHLGTRLVVVLGHTQCGAVGASLEGHGEGAVGCILAEIAAAIGEERDELAACRLNVMHGVSRIREAFSKRFAGLEVAGAVYRTHSGEVEFL